MASAIAVGLVEKGHKVHLTTTDPAAHLEFVFQNSELNEQLTISRINSTEEVEDDKAEVLSKVSSALVYTISPFFHILLHIKKILRKY
ncbi:arsenical pump-driving ATPase [Parageobacillus genomosp. 1]|uniref:Arsenical pump-driving ATPase n=2 Tax=Parageobacillus genomosp. 1 TaxID=1295642 RepID=A0ABC9VEL9_9BACL|nr:arsenical pump-driving ATPase [Parageobacillus genomosp. 1]